MWGPRLNFANWATRLRIKRPLSRKLSIAPDDLIGGAVPPSLTRFVADAAFDPLAGTLDFLIAIYAGDTARATRALARVDGDPAALSRLLAENELRKLVIGCFRRAIDKGSLDGARAALLLDFARRFDPIFGMLSERTDEPRATPRLDFDYAGRIPDKLRVVVLASSATPRPHDLAVRLASAFAGNGVGCVVMPSETDPAEIGANDLVLIDEDTAFRKDPERRLAHVDGLRKVARRLGRLVPDPWGWDFQGRLARSADRYDFFWGMAPRLREAESIKSEKVCLIPFPTGFGHVFDEVVGSGAPHADFGFCGAIEDYNVHRYFWLLAALAGTSGLRIGLTSQQADGLETEPSLRLYLGRLLSTAACLSLTMRSSGDRIMVGRTFDVLRGGRLLIQEYTPDARYYLNPGEDFVEVQEAGELREVGERTRSGAYEPIRAQGAATFARAYSDQAVVRHLATWV